MNTERTAVRAYQDLFCHRADRYAEQTKNGSYFVHPSPITDRVIVSHLSGRMTAGFYALDRDSTCRWAVLDADRPDGLSQLQRAWRDLAGAGIPSYLELSRRGGHLWTFFAEPTPGRAARQLLLGIVRSLDGLELYPKQDVLDRSHPVGSLIRGPLGVHQLTGQRYPFVDPVSLRPVARGLKGMIEYLAGSDKVGLTKTADKLGLLLSHARTARERDQARQKIAVPARGKRPSPIERVKERIGDTYSFVSRFVELDGSGRGHCPFHPPDYHPSFVVSRALDRWTCFHETDSSGHYWGGDGIDFYIRLKGLTYAQALRELQNL